MPCRAGGMRQEEPSRNWSRCTNEALFRPLQSQFYMERWVNRVRLSTGWKRLTRRGTLNLYISRQVEDSSHCVKIRDLDNSYAVSGYPIKAPTKNVALGGRQ